MPLSLAPPAPTHLVAVDAEERALLLARRQARYGAEGVSYDLLTSLGAPVLVAPSRVRFRDTRGRWMAGVSEPKIDPNSLRIDLRVAGYDPCPRKAHWGRACRCTKRLVGLREGPANLLTNVFANFVRTGILGTNTTITDSGGTGRALTKTLDGGIVSASTAICAGTGVAAATVADTNMQTQTEQIANPTVNTVTGAGATGTFTVVGTVTATADRQYTEVGIKVTTTTTTWTFLIAHDSFAALSVSNTGTLAVTYSFTNT
jgi:hypothetical protein